MGEHNDGEIGLIEGIRPASGERYVYSLEYLIIHQHDGAAEKWRQIERAKIRNASPARRRADRNDRRRGVILVMHSSRVDRAARRVRFARPAIVQ